RLLHERRRADRHHVARAAPRSPPVLPGRAVDRRFLLRLPLPARRGRDRGGALRGGARHLRLDGRVRALRDRYRRQLCDRASGPLAFRRAGVTPGDVDMCMVYDSYTITVLTTLEGLGFCPRGESGAFCVGGRIGLGGALPVNTDGGGLSSNHPGMRGIFLVIEATRQLRGEAGPVQVR